jgi:hypothetical protein
MRKAALQPCSAQLVLASKTNRRPVQKQPPEERAAVSNVIGETLHSYPGLRERLGTKVAWAALRPVSRRSSTSAARIMRP